MARRGAFLLVLVAVSCLGWQPARADKYDLRLQRLWQYDNGSWGGRIDTTTNQRINKDEAFARLMGDLGAALSPRFLGPGATTGALGFKLGFNFALTNIPENAQHWRVGMTPSGNTGDPLTSTPDGADSYLTAFQFQVRKGLPFSAEVGGSVTKLLQSDLWGVGLEAKYAALEGFKFAPEIAFRAGISTFLGAKDYALLLASGDVNISKEIGIAGLFNLAPYVGYQMLYVHGASNVIPLIRDGADIEQGVFASANEFRHLLVMGFQVVATVVNTGFEVSLSPADVEDHSFAFLLGVDF